MISDGKIYTVDNEDEVEDLYRLLSSVIKVHPDIKGVSVGALLSNYQRVRVENVCSRLGLTCYAYLWRYSSQLTLLQDMKKCHINAILVKIAGIGLVKSHIGSTIEEMYDTFVQLERSYGLHPAGEGGEYETCVLDCPLFKKKIVLDDFHVVVQSNDIFSPVMHISNIKTHLIDKPNFEADLKETISFLKIKYLSHLPNLLMKPEEISDTIVDSVGSVERDKIHDEITIDDDEIFTVSICGQGDDYRTQSQFVLQRANEMSLMKGYSANDAIFRMIYLQDISYFADFNKIYSEFVGTNHPSPRACIGTCLPKDILVMLEAAYTKPSNIGEILHVQSTSYWAPANIGPYSQSLIYHSQYSCSQIIISGQIGMIPYSLDIPENNLPLECELSLKHVRKIVNASLFETSDDSGDFIPDLKITDRNILIAEYNSEIAPIISAKCFVTDEVAMKQAKEEERKMMGDRKTMPCLYLVISNLPKDARVEWVIRSGLPLIQNRYLNTLMENDEFDTRKFFIGYSQRQEILQGSSISVLETSLSCDIDFKDRNILSLIAVVKTINIETNTNQLDIDELLNLLCKKRKYKSATLFITHITNIKHSPSMRCSFVPVRAVDGGNAAIEINF